MKKKSVAIRKATIRKLARRAGIKRVSDIYPIIRETTEKHIKDVLMIAKIYCDYDKKKRKTISVEDMSLAIERISGKRVYC